jgi:hypothetical protein
MSWSSAGTPPGRPSPDCWRTSAGTSLSSKRIDSRVDLQLAPRASEHHVAQKDNTMFRSLFSPSRAMPRVRLWKTLIASVAALMLEAPPAVAQMAAPTVNLIERVLMVQSVVPQGKAGTINVVGTIFSIDIDHREYWLTAKHILTGAKHPPYGSVTEKSVSLSILNPNAQGEQWESVNFSVIDPGRMSIS